RREGGDERGLGGRGAAGEAELARGLGEERKSGGGGELGDSAPGGGLLDGRGAGGDEPAARAPDHGGGLGDRRRGGRETRGVDGRRRRERRRLNGETGRLEGLAGTGVEVDRPGRGAERGGDGARAEAAQRGRGFLGQPELDEEPRVLAEELGLIDGLRG